MSQKTIQINPEYLSVSGRRKKDKNNSTRKERKVKPTAIVNPSKLRKELLNRIKEHQDKSEKESKIIEEPKNDDMFTNEFNNSMNYLEELSKKRKERRKQQKLMKQTKKQQRQQQIGGNIFVNTELPDEMNMNTLQPTVTTSEMPINIVPNHGHHNHTIKNQPLYSSLKNGSRPTFRQMIRNTTSSSTPPPTNVVNALPPPINVGAMPSFIPTNPTLPINVGSMPPVIPTNSTPPSIVTPPQSTTINTPSNFQRTNTIKNINTGGGIQDKTKPKKPTREKRIKTYKYKLGKKDNNVSVLIKNNSTRKNVKKAHAELKKNNMLEIKKYLKKHNLLKAGSDAPPDVLRQLYEQTRLAGEINNNNSDNLLHNYLSN